MPKLSIRIQKFIGQEILCREIPQQTSHLPNFAGSDRAMLAKLALLGRFRFADERMFLKRFHADVSWALDHNEQKSFLTPMASAIHDDYGESRLSLVRQEESRLALAS